MTEPRARILGFDGVRAIAFLLVFVSHKAPTQLTESYGGAGVWMFFVLSGFLITRILAASRGRIEQGRTTPLPALADFYVRRTLRIFPIYYLFLTIMAVLGARGLVDLGGVHRQISDWLFLSNIYIEYSNNWAQLGHLWSLAVEEQYYLLFAPMALLLPLRRLPYLCAGLIAVTILTHVVLIARGADRIHFDANSLVNFGLMGLGGLAGLMADRPLPKVLRGDLLMVLALGGFLILPTMMPEETWFRTGRLGAVLVALLLVQIYQNQNGRVVAVLNCGPVRGLGMISYGAYLIHVVIDCRAVFKAAGWNGPPMEVVGVLMDMFVTIVLATLSWRYFESPIRALAGRLRTQAGIPAAPA